MSEIKFVLCDDNENFLNTTKSLIDTIFLKHDIKATISYMSNDPYKILEYIQKHPADVLFLDIDLNTNMTGIELAQKFRVINKNAYIVFLTGHFEYSMLAFKVKTFDYLVKPVLPERIEETILRLYDDMQSENASRFIKLCNGKYLLKKNDILYIEKLRTKAIVHTAKSDIEIYGTFSDIQSCLPENFVRCQKSYIVNMDKVTRIDSQKNFLYLDDVRINFSNYYTQIGRMIDFNGKIIN